MAWPTEVPVVDPTCCWKGTYDSPDGEHHCTIGWFLEMFPDGLCLGVAETLAEDILEGTFNTRDITHWNDASRRRKADIAKLVNRTTAVLGYTEGNPEAEFARRWCKKHGKPREADL